MSGHSADKAFAGSIPEVYDTILVPMVFASYAEDLARRVAARRPGRVLEIAAGTGVLTRALATALPESAAIIATDLNQPMLDRASLVGTCRTVEWRQADAMALPFGDGSFDAVVCQFGAMFFPDKAHAFAQARRVLAPGGFLLFNVWDRIEENEFAAWLSRGRSDHAGSGHGRLRQATLARDAHRAQPGRIPADPGNRILSGDSAAQRDRIAGCRRSCRCNRRLCGCACEALWGGRGRRPDPGAHRHRRRLSCGGAC